MRKRLKADLYLPRPPVGALRFIEPTETPEYRDLRRYVVERLPGGCVVYWLGRKEQGKADVP